MYLQKPTQDAFPEQNFMVRSSIYKLFLMIGIGLAGIDLLYTVSTFLLSQVYLVQTPLPFNLHHHAFLSMFLLGVVKSVLQLIWIGNLFIHWASESFLISKSQITHRKGLFSLQETMNDLRNIRSVEVSQSLIGKLLNFGDIDIETSASGGFHGHIHAIGIPFPHQFERLVVSNKNAYTE